jgi:UDP-N-acetylglucosamine 2-epimerase (non-hydrolysing)
MKISIIFGTRPEVIKLAPLALQARRCGHEVRMIFTGQHRDMVIPLLRLFGLAPDLDLEAMAPNQSLAGLSSRILASMDLHREKILADVIAVQGDTTSAFIAAYWAFLNRVPVAHVEAGLRTYDLQAPYPEEANRQLVGRLANMHFAPTVQAAQSLRNEYIREGVHVVGNTSIDALLYCLARIRLGDVPPQGVLRQEIRDFASHGNVILVTAHRRENHGDGMKRICDALLQIVERNPGARIVYPVHPNPNVQGPVHELLGTHRRILLCEPLPYLAFIEMMDCADVLLTDSGGVQEEGPTLRKPILVMRDTTERPEGVTAGFAKLLGTDTDKIVEASLAALKEGCTTDAQNPYGDGMSSERIVAILERAFSKEQIIANPF